MHKAILIITNKWILNFMKYFLYICIITLSLFLPKSAMAGQNDYSILCNYCTTLGKQVKAEQTAFIDGQMIKIIDQQGDKFIVNEYQVTSGGNSPDKELDYDDFIVTLTATHSQTSVLSQEITNAYRIMKAAVKKVNDEATNIELTKDDYYQSAFQIMEQTDYFAIKMSEKIMNDPETKEQFDIIEAQTQNLKSNLSISVPLLGTALSIGNQVIVSFTDHTKVYLNVELKSSNGSNIYINLKFYKAVDRDRNSIPTKACGLGNYRQGENLNDINTGNMDFFAEWFAKLEMAQVKIIRTGTGHRGGSGSIKDCNYEIYSKPDGALSIRLNCS